MPRPVCLVCEDEMLISIDVEACLDEIGVAIAGPFATGADALQWAAIDRPDVAVLDYWLQDGECLPLIDALQQQKVPIIIHSGWLPDEAEMPPAISGLPWVSKPMDYNILLKALTAAVPQIILPESMDGTDAMVESANGGHIRINGNLEGAGMPFSRYNGMFEPTDLDLLQRVFDQLCKKRRLAKKDREQREVLAEKIVHTFGRGIGNEADLLLAMTEHRTSR